MNNIWKELFSSQNNKKAQEQGGLFDSSIPQGARLFFIVLMKSFNDTCFCYLLT